MSTLDFLLRFARAHTHPVEDDRINESIHSHKMSPQSPLITSVHEAVESQTCRPARDTMGGRSVAEAAVIAQPVH